MAVVQRWQSLARTASIAILVTALAALAATIASCGTQSSDDDSDPQVPGSGGVTGASGQGSGGSTAGSGGTNAMTGSGGTSNGRGPNGSGGASGPSGSGGGTAAGGSGGSTAMTDGGVPEPTTGPFPAVTDLTGDGPFTATTMVGVGPNSNYTVHLPTELAPNGAKNPIVAWMSGGSTGPDLYVLLPHLATHGFVVIASNTIPGIGAEVELGQELVDGISWALEQNKQQDSMLFGKLDETKIASMGYSMGSLATFTIADDPRLTTTVHISGGNMEPDRVGKLKQPAAFFCGIPTPDCANLLDTACDIAGYNCQTDFMNATTPVFYGVFNYGHLGILTDPYAAQIADAVTGWLRWKLMGDTTLESMFVGDQCTLCKDTANWTVQQKNL